MFGQGLDPFELFGFNRRNWWEGSNVCVERKVLTEDSDEPEDATEEDIAEAEREQSRRRSKFFTMDTSFTTCRDDFNYHECTTQISRNGGKKHVSVRYQCCYGYERSDTGIGCTRMIMEDLETTIKNLGVTEFAELLETSGVMSELENNVTVFVPSNDAVEDFR